VKINLTHPEPRRSGGARHQFPRSAGTARRPLFRDAFLAGAPVGDAAGGRSPLTVAVSWPGPAAGSVDAARRCSLPRPRLARHRYRYEERSRKRGGRAVETSLKYPTGPPASGRPEPGPTRPDRPAQAGPESRLPSSAGVSGCGAGRGGDSAGHVPRPVGWARRQPRVGCLRSGSRAPGRSN